MNCSAAARRSVLLVIVVLAGLAVARGNGDSRPMGSHEVFVAQTAGEMLESGDYLIPRFAGQLRLQKPPLAYWLSALAQRLSGEGPDARVSEFHARLPSVLAALLLLLVTYGIGKVAFADPRVGLVAAAVMAATWDFFRYSRSARPEMLYALFCTLMVLGIVLAVRRIETDRAQSRGGLLVWASLAGALFAKGPQHPLFFLLGTALALWLRRPRASFAGVFRPYLGILLLLPVLAYFVYVASQVDSVLGFWTKQMIQDQPIPVWLRPFRFYYPWTLVVGLVPWVVALGVTALVCWRIRPPNVALLGWMVLVSIAFLAFAGKLRHHYVLPLTPICSVLVAWALVRVRDGVPGNERGGKSMAWLLAAQSALIGLAFVVLGVRSLDPGPLTGEPAWPSALGWLLLCVVLILAALAWRRRSPDRSFAVLVLSAFVAWTCVSHAGLDVSPRWSIAAEFSWTFEEDIPPDATLFFDSGERELLIYYAERELEPGSLRDWPEAYAGMQTPYFVCWSHIPKALGIEGTIVRAQREVKRRKTMVLFQPSPTPAPVSASPGGSS
jgi:4-amino-4-deoxy-L-arabinose transferase-like glycosyltransferase